MSDNPPDWSNDNFESPHEEPNVAPSSFQNPDNAGHDQASSSYQSGREQLPPNQWVYQPRPWHRIFRNFLTMGNEQECAYLLHEPTATLGQGIRWYAMVSAITSVTWLVVMLIVFAITPADLVEEYNQRFVSSSYNYNTTSGYGNNRTATTNPFTFDNETEYFVFTSIFTPFSLVLSIVISLIGLGVIHVVATGLFKGQGQYDKLVYGAFTFYASIQTATFLVMLMLFPFVFLLIWLVPILLLPLYCLYIMLALLISLYLLYLLTLIVKTVYQFGWGEAFVSAVVIPVGGGIFLYCAFIFCLIILLASVSA